MPDRLRAIARQWKPIVAVATILALSCCGYPPPKFDSNDPIPVRESCDRSGGPLPLTSVAVDSIRTFIEQGSRCQPPGAGSSIGDMALYDSLLAFFRIGVNCVCDSVPELLRRHGLKPESKGRAVFDARQDYGPDQDTRHAYRFGGYWFILYAVTEAANGLPLAPSAWRYSDLIVEKDFAVQGPR